MSLVKGPNTCINKQHNGRKPPLDVKTHDYSLWVLAIIHCERHKVHYNCIKRPFKQAMRVCFSNILLFGAPLWYTLTFVPLLGLGFGNKKWYHSIFVFQQLFLYDCASIRQQNEEGFQIQKRKGVGAKPVNFYHQKAFEAHRNMCV